MAPSPPPLDLHILITPLAITNCVRKKKANFLTYDIYILRHDLLSPSPPAYVATRNPSSPRGGDQHSAAPSYSARDADPTGYSTVHCAPRPGVSTAPLIVMC